VRAAWFAIAAAAVALAVGCGATELDGVGGHDAGGAPEPTLPPGCALCSGPDCPTIVDMCAIPSTTPILCPADTPRPESARYCKSDACAHASGGDKDAGTDFDIPCLFCCCFSPPCP